jgi:hypothetical protein
MTEMISHCGLRCDRCAAFEATLEDDDTKRREVAAKWSKQYNADIRPGDINCEGCLSTGTRVFKHCNVCEIRKCGIEKGVPNCAHCNEYVCSKLEDFLKAAPGNRELLEEIRKDRDNF